MVKGLEYTGSVWYCVLCIARDRVVSMLRNNANVQSLHLIEAASAQLLYVCVML